MQTVGFDQALVALWEGHRAARLGWNGKGMWVYAVPGGTYPAQTPAARENLGNLVAYGPYMAMRGATGEVSPWLPAQPDMFAKDWVILRSTERKAALNAA